MELLTVSKVSLVELGSYVFLCCVFLGKGTYNKMKITSPFVDCFIPDWLICQK